MTTTTPTEIARQIVEAYREYDDAKARSLTDQAIALFGRDALLAVAYPTVRDNGELDKSFAEPPAVQASLSLDAQTDGRRRSATATAACAADTVWFGSGTPLDVLLRRRKESQLLKSGQVVLYANEVDDLAVHHRQEEDLGHLHRLAGRWHPHELAPVRPAASEAGRHPVALGDNLLDVLSPVGKGRTKDLESLFYLG